MSRKLNLKLYFSEMKDPRIDRCKRHLLEDIVFITIAAVLSGAETWNDIEMYGIQKKDWLKSVLSLPNGIPKHDTFNRFFAALNPLEFERCFLNWIKDICKSFEGEIISIDGKTMCGSKGKDAKSATHIVSAWASENELILGQIKTDQKSNEITAIPELLESLLIEGNIVTIDAMGCQKDIAKKIKEKNADYILAVKDNQKELRHNIEDSFRFLSDVEISEKSDFGHGRIELRKCSIIRDLSMIENKDKWADLNTLIMIESERQIKATGKTERETRYYISSSSCSADAFNDAIRSHWGIENKVHWSLDVSFNEDSSRKRANNAAQNFSTVCRIALNLLKKDNTKIGIKGKRLKAGWNNDFILELINL